MSDDQQQIKGFTFVQGFDRQFEKVRDNPDLTLKFLNALRDYWFRGVEPSFDDPRDGMIWEGIGDLLVRTRQNRQIRSTAQLGNQNAKKPSKTNENETKRTETKQNDEKRTETIKTNENETKQENRREENRRVEESKDTLPPTNTPVASKPRQRKTVGDIRRSHPKAMAFWEAVRAVYPSNRRHAPADYTLCQIEQDGLCERQDEIIATVKRFIAEDDEWKRGYIPRMGNFFKDQLWQNDPTPPKPPEVREIQTIRTSKPAMPTFNIDPRETAI